MSSSGGGVIIISHNSVTYPPVPEGDPRYEKILAVLAEEVPEENPPDLLPEGTSTE